MVSKHQPLGNCCLVRSAGIRPVGAVYLKWLRQLFTGTKGEWLKSVMNENKGGQKGANSKQVEAFIPEPICYCASNSSEQVLPEMIFGVLYVYRAV